MESSFQRVEYSRHTQIKLVPIYSKCGVGPVQSSVIFWFFFFSYTSAFQNYSKITNVSLLHCIFLMKVFDGPLDYSDIDTVTSLFPMPVDARYIRILPTEWDDDGQTCLRFELLGCNGM